MADNKQISINKDFIIENWNAVANNDLIKTSLEELTCKNISGDCFIGDENTAEGAGKFLKTGIFFFPHKVETGDALSGAPENLQKGWLISYRSRGNGITQFFCAFDSNESWQRKFNGSNFTAWRRLLTDVDKQEIEDRINDVIGSTAVVREDIAYSAGDEISFNYHACFQGFIDTNPDDNSIQWIIFTAPSGKDPSSVSYHLDKAQLNIYWNGYLIGTTSSNSYNTNFLNLSDSTSCYKGSTANTIIIALKKENNNKWQYYNGSTMVNVPNKQVVTVEVAEGYWLVVTCTNS